MQPPQRSFADVEYEGAAAPDAAGALSASSMDALMPWARLEARLRPVYPTGERGTAALARWLLLRIHCVHVLQPQRPGDGGRALRQRGGAAVRGAKRAGTRGPMRRRSSISGTCWNGALGRRAAGRDHPASGGTGPAAAPKARSWTRPSSTPRRRRRTGPQARDPEMHQVKKGNQWYFGMKAHIGVDAATGLVHSVATTAAQRGGYHASAAAPPRCRDARVGRCGVLGRGPTPGACKVRRIDWQVALRPRAAAALGARQCRRPSGAAQGLHPGEGGASVLVREAPLRLWRRCGIGDWPRTGPGALLLGFANLLLAERAAPAHKRAICAPRRGADGLPRCLAGPQPRITINPTPPGALPRPPELWHPVVQSFPRVRYAQGLPSVL